MQRHFLRFSARNRNLKNHMKFQKGNKIFEENRLISVN